MRLLNLLDFLYHVDQTAVTDIIDAMSDHARLDVLAVAEESLAELTALEVVSAQQAHGMNVLTFIIDAIKLVPAA